MKNFFIPVDFSKLSTNAVIYASEMAKLISARLTLFNAYHVPVVPFDTGYIPPSFDMKDGAEKEMKKLIKKVKTAHPSLAVSSIVKIGFAGDLIEQTAKECGADVIIMGITSNASVLKEHVLGSISTQLARESCIPVLIVPEDAKFKKLEKIGFACDYNKELEHDMTLTKVKSFCSMFNAELEILNVEKPGEEVSVEKSEVENYVEQHLKNTNHKTYFITGEEMDKGVLELVHRNSIDMVITCPRKHGMFHNIFTESKTEKLAFHSPVPILGIHSEPLSSAEYNQ